MAWRLLSGTHQARETPDAPPTTVLTSLEVQVLEAVCGREFRTLELAVREIAKLGGYEHYRNKRLPPGATAMWWGLQRLVALVCGWAAAFPLQRAGDRTRLLYPDGPPDASGDGLHLFEQARADADPEGGKHPFDLPAVLDVEE